MSPHVTLGLAGREDGRIGTIGDITVDDGGGPVAFPIRGLPPDVVDKLDVAAAERGLSRNAYVVEILVEHARRVRPTVTAESFASVLRLAADLGDEEMMRSAWS